MTAPQTEPKWAGWGLWWRWVGATLAGMVLAIGIEAILWISLGTIIMLEIASATNVGFGLARNVAVILFTIVPGVIGALAMGTIGALQWRVLKRYLGPARKWMIANALAGALAGIATVGPFIVAAETSAHRPDGRQVALTAILLILDLLIIGMAQWLVMRRELPRSGWWVPTSALSGLFGAVLLVFDLMPDTGAIVISILLYPVVTGIALVWLLTGGTSQTLNYELKPP